MTADFQEIDGVGPSRDEDLQEAGYTEYADLADTDANTLESQIPRLSEDTALEIIVQAQNLTDLQDASVQENPDTQESETITVTENPGEENTQGSENEPVDETDEDKGENTHTVSLTINTAYQYDALYDALLSYRQKLLSTNLSGTDTVTELIDELRDTVVGEAVEFELTGDEINNIHNALLQHRIDYQGKNFHDQLTAAKKIEMQFNEERERILF
jgi:hypothetical protein